MADVFVLDAFRDAGPLNPYSDEEKYQLVAMYSAGHALGLYDGYEFVDTPAISTCVFFKNICGEKQRFITFSKLLYPSDGKIHRARVARIDADGDLCGTTYYKRSSLEALIYVLQRDEEQKFDTFIKAQAVQAAGEKVVSLDDFRNGP